MKVLLFNYGQVLEGIAHSLAGAGHTVKTIHPSSAHQWPPPILNHIETSGYDYLFPSHSDKDTAIIAGLNEKLGLPGIKPNTARHIATKLDYYHSWDSLGIPHPGIFQVLGNDISKLRPDHSLPYPCVLKPESGSAGLGVKVIKDPKDFLTHASKCILDKYRFINQRLLVQEYVAGDVSSVVGRVSGGIVYIDLLFDLECRGDYPIETGYYYPSRHAGIIEDDLRAHLQTYCQHIELDNSPFMLDVIVAPDGVYWIDFGARVSFNPQNLIWHGGERDYGRKLIDNLLYGQPLTMNLQHPAVISRQLPVPAGSHTEVICEREDLAVKINLTKNVKTPMLDGEVYNTCYAIVTGNSLEDAENKFQALSDSVRIIP